MPDKPPVDAELIWSHDLQFGATSGTTAIVIDGNGSAGPSPVHTLAMALAACMSSDIVDILRKGRHQFTAFRAKVTGYRAPEPPRHLVAVSLAFTIHGTVPEAAVERAIALSRDESLLCLALTPPGHRVLHALSDFPVSARIIRVRPHKSGEIGSWTRSERSFPYRIELRWRRHADTIRLFHRVRRTAPGHNA